MTSRNIFLVGAPTFSSLRWDESELLNEPVPPFRDPDSRYEASGLLLPLKDTSGKWRLLAGLSIPETPEMKGPRRMAGEALFLTTNDLQSSTGMRAVISEDSELSRFYNHSFTVHETSEISAPGATPDESVLDSGQWTESMATSFASNDEGETKTTRPPIHGGITNLSDIPSAPYLESIVPQTMTVNLIAAIIVIRPSRRILTRQWKRELDLVEVVVGDETRTGFGVTFWLPPSTVSSATRRCGDTDGEELRKSLMSLRPRDIVLLRTVGLSCFRERVYGQSLRGALTKIDLMHRQQVDATDLGGIYNLRDILSHAAESEDPLLVKVRKVRDWIRRFVPDAAGGSTKPGRIVTLPPDTQ
ncbi:hypothetical protein BJY04DRAFT_187865 [Aspergillus karnatakaensis]|uniref:uncharacterized protein n=1 Tax=Aspergillus karnatakaensis TaxID=1810916 RepID=UPI003CCDE88B